MSVAAGSGRSNYYRQVLIPIGVARVATWPALALARAFDVGCCPGLGYRYGALVEVVGVIYPRIVNHTGTNDLVGVVRLHHPDLPALGAHVHRLGEHLRGGQRTDLERIARAAETLTVGIALVIDQLAGTRIDHFQVGGGDVHPMCGQIETVRNRKGIGWHVYLSLDLPQRTSKADSATKHTFCKSCAEVKGVVGLMV